jgi:flavorubredoxin
MGKALIVFASRTGETKKIGELIAEGIRISGMEAELKNVNDIKSEADLKGYDAVVFGSATYHGKMIQSMEKVLFLAEKAELENKVGGSFGAFGWSGEAPDRIFDTMANIFKMNMVSAALRLKSSSLGGGTTMAQNYGRELAKKMAG